MHYSLKRYRFAMVSTDGILWQQISQYFPPEPYEVRYDRVILLSPDEKLANWTLKLGNATSSKRRYEYWASSEDDEDPHYVQPMSSYRRQKRIDEDSSSYESEKPEVFEHDECVAQHEWQKLSYSTCNLFHEQDLKSFFREERIRRKGRRRRVTDTNKESVRILANGGWRDVWALTPYNDVRIHQDQDQEQQKVVDEPTKHVLKTLRYKHDLSERTIDTHRIDSLVMERLTSSQHVMNIHGYCGTSGLFPFADGPDISQTIWPEGAEKDGDISREQFEASSKLHTKLELLHIAVQATMGLAAFHNFAKEGYPSIVHNDISPTQWIKIGDTYKLNDFNRARLLSWNPANESVCAYHEGYNPGKRRSPEGKVVCASSVQCFLLMTVNINAHLLLHLTLAVKEYVLGPQTAMVRPTKQCMESGLRLCLVSECS